MTALDSSLQASKVGILVDELLAAVVSASSMVLDVLWVCPHAYVHIPMCALQLDTCCPLLLVGAKACLRSDECKVRDENDTVILSPERRGKKRESAVIHMISWEIPSDWLKGTVMGLSFPQRRVHLHALKLLLQFGLSRGITHSGGIQGAPFPKAVTSGLENTTHTPDPRSPWLTFFMLVCSSLMQNTRRMDKFVSVGLVPTCYSCDFRPGAEESAPLWCWEICTLVVLDPSALLRLLSYVRTTLQVLWKCSSWTRRWGCRACTPSMPSGGSDDAGPGSNELQDTEESSLHLGQGRDIGRILQKGILCIKLECLVNTTITFAEYLHPC